MVSHEEILRKREIIKKAWEESRKKVFFFHGTNVLAYKKIKRYGLVPGMNIYDLRELMILVDFMKKAGCEKPIGYWFLKQSSNNIYLSNNNDHAKLYAKTSPEFFSQLCNPRFYPETGFLYDFENCYRVIYAKLMGEDNSRLKGIPKNQLDSYVKQNSSLTKKEINLGLKIFIRLWNLFGTIDKVVLYISIDAPQVKNHLSEYYYNFEEFLERLSEALSSEFRIITRKRIYPYYPENYALAPDEEILEEIFKILEIGCGNQEYKIGERIPTKYIVKTEVFTKQDLENI